MAEKKPKMKCNDLACSKSRIFKDVSIGIKNFFIIALLGTIAVVIILLVTGVIPISLNFDIGGLGDLVP